MKLNITQSFWLFCSVIFGVGIFITVFHPVSAVYLSKAPELFIHLFLIGFLLSIACISNQSKIIVLFALFASAAYFIIFQNLNWVFCFMLFLLLCPSTSLEKLQVNGSKFLHFAIYFWTEHFFKALSVGVTIGVFLFFRNSYASYFEGDEWVFLRQFAPLVASKWWFVIGFLKSFIFTEGQAVHITPISDFIYLLEFKFFQLDFAKYLTVAVVLHIIVSLVIAKLIFQLTHSKISTLIGFTFFTFNSIHSEGVVWILAAIYTELAVLFGIVSLILIHGQLIQSNSNKKLWFGYLSLLFALWCKETAFIFPLMMFGLLWSFRKLNRQKLHYILLCSVITLFVLSEVIGHRTQIFSQDSLHVSQDQLWTYSLIDHVNKIPYTEIFYRYTALFFKMLAQSFIPTRFLSWSSQQITEIQFPYFNQEKLIGGPNYANFTQNSMIELLSYFFGGIVLMFFFMRSEVRSNRIYRYGIMYWALSVIPIWAILIGFPWLKYDALIGSRHFYHVLPGIALLIGILGNELFQTARKTFGRDKSQLLLLLTLSLFFLFQYQTQQGDTLQKQRASDFTARKKIVEEIHRKLQPTPARMILFSKSNRSYYGFADLMLPFPIPMYQILPVITSKQYFSQGFQYPNSFFMKQYDQGFSKGLVAQGYHEENGVGLGYFLDRNKLIKLLEKEHFDASLVYSFTFDGKENTFTDITNETRFSIQEMLDRRTLFQNWNRYGTQSEFFTFQTDPSWQVSEQSSTYFIQDGASKIMSIQVFTPETGEVFSKFVGEQRVNGKPIGDSFETSLLHPDLDDEQLVYISRANKNIWFLYAGNNLMFYRLELFDPKKSEKVLRTFEFSDGVDEVLYDSLPASPSASQKSP